MAANVLWDARREYLRQFRRPGLSRPLRDDRDVHTSVEDEALARLSVGELANACRRGTISKLEYELVLRTRMAGVPLTEIAGAPGQRLSYGALVQRRWRAEGQLRKELPRAG